MSDESERWGDELAGLVRLYAQGKATFDEVTRATVRMVSGTDYTDGALEYQLLLPALLTVAGRAIEEGHDLELFEAVKSLVDQCPDDAVRAPFDGVMRAYGEVMAGAVSIAAVRQARAKHFGP